jgi:hypothetical protein
MQNTIVDHINYLSKQSQVFYVATKGYVSLLKVLKSEADTPEIEQSLKYILAQLTGKGSQSPSLTRQQTPAVAQQVQTKPISQSAQAQPQVNKLKAELIDRLSNIDDSLNAKELQNSKALESAWKQLHLRALHLPKSKKDELLSYFSKFTNPDAKTQKIFSSVEQVIIPTLALNGKTLVQGVEFHTDKDTLCIFDELMSNPVLDPKVVGGLNSVYYLYQESNGLASAYQSITPRGYESFTEDLFSKWSILLMNTLQKLSNDSGLTQGNSYLLVELDELLSSIFYMDLLPNRTSWFESFLYQLRLLTSVKLRSLGVTDFDWGYKSLMTAKSKTVNNVLINSSAYEPGTVVRTLRGSCSHKSYNGVKLGRVMYVSN